MTQIMFLPLVEDTSILCLRTGIFVNLLTSLEVKSNTWGDSVGRFLNRKFILFLRFIFPLFSRVVFFSFLLFRYQYYLF